MKHRKNYVAYCLFIMAALFSVAFISCSSDDDDDDFGHHAKYFFRRKRLCLSMDSPKHYNTIQVRSAFLNGQYVHLHPRQCRDRKADTKQAG